MLWTLEGAGSLVAGVLTLDLVIGATVYSPAVLVASSRRFRVLAGPRSNHPQDRRWR
jgi:hypothetical protein